MRVNTSTYASQHTCPLCLDLLGAEFTRACGVCNARVHSACAHEFGMCHPTPGAVESIRVTETPAPTPQREPIDWGSYASLLWLPAAPGFFVLALARVVETDPVTGGVANADAALWFLLGCVSLFMIFASDVLGSTN